MKKKFGIVMTASVICTSLILGVPIQAAESGTGTSSNATNSQIFSIPANSFCDQSHEMHVSLNVTNTGATDSSVTLSLTKQDGTPLTVAGTEYNGIQSTIIPDAPATIPAGQTAFYHIAFGGAQNVCTSRAFSGKVTVDSATGGSIVASGWVSGTNGNSTISINSGNPFVVAATAPEPEPTPEPTPEPSATNLIPAMTSNTSASPVVVSSSSDYASTFQAYMAFNGTYASNSDIWASAIYTSSGWLKVDFGTPKLVQKYTVYNRRANTDAPKTSPKTWTFEGSNDDSNWTVLDSRSNETTWSIGDQRTYQYVNSTSYRYYRMNISANNSGPYIAISELQMF